MGDNTIWSDLNRDGRRLEGIIKQMHTKQKNEAAKDEPDTQLQFAYIDRLVKLTNLKVHVAETVLGVNEVLKQAKKQGLQKPTIQEVPQIIA